MAHCNGGDAMLAAAQAGVDSIEHGAYAHSDALHAMAENGVVWVPTLSTVGNLLGKGRFDDGQVRRILEDTMEKLSIFVDFGGLVAPGSDAGAWSVPHGCHTECQWLEKAGVGEDRQQMGLQKITEKF
jgi:imidazolonepropionase-like amidohydrolase